MTITLSIICMVLGAVVYDFLSNAMAGNDLYTGKCHD